MPLLFSSRSQNVPNFIPNSDAQTSKHNVIHFEWFYGVYFFPSMFVCVCAKIAFNTDNDVCERARCWHLKKVMRNKSMIHDSHRFVSIYMQYKNEKTDEIIIDDDLQFELLFFNISFVIHDSDSILISFHSHTHTLPTRTNKPFSYISFFCFNDLGQKGKIINFDHIPLIYRVFHDSVSISNRNNRLSKRKMKKKIGRKIRRNKQFQKNFQRFCYSFELIIILCFKDIDSESWNSLFTNVCCMHSNLLLIRSQKLKRTHTQQIQRDYSVHKKSQKLLFEMESKSNCGISVKRQRIISFVRWFCPISLFPCDWPLFTWRTRLNIWSTYIMHR